MANLEESREQLEALATRADELAGELATVNEQRAQAVRTHLAAGASITATAQAAGLSRVTIYAIRDRA